MLSVTRTILLFFLHQHLTFVHGFIFRYKYNDGDRMHSELSQIVLAQQSEADHPGYDFPQKLDHFNIIDQRVWNQKHWREAKYYALNGPVFLFIGGESEARPTWLSTTEWSFFAIEYRAMIFLLEHRYYGASQPFEKQETANLQYLYAEQAIADIAYFIENMNREHHLPPGTKWIVFGGSYAGSLAAWARVKYPHLIHAAYASSAPLLAKANFKEYAAAVQEALASYSEKCVDNIKRANAMLSKMIRTKQGKSEIKEIFNLCDDLKKRNDVVNFFGTLADTLAAAVQYHHEVYRPHINSVCDIMATSRENDVSAVHQLAAVLKHMNPPNEPCVSVSYDDMIKDYQTALNGSTYYRAWLYQCCTEYGYFQTSGRKSDLFGPHVPFQYFTRMCQDVFGPRFDKTFLDDAVQRTNRVFGDLNVNTTNILFVHGSIDPWRTLGVTNSPWDEAHKVVYIQGASHCADVYLHTLPDKEDIMDASNKITEAISLWFT